MHTTDITICIGGEAGQGLATIGHALGKALTRSGRSLHVTQVYESRIRGGHNTFSLRVTQKTVGAPSGTVDLLIALDEVSVALHKAELTPKAVVISGETAEPLPRGHLRVPSANLAGGGHENTVMLGVAGYVLDLGVELLEDALAASLGKLTPEARAQNLNVLQNAYGWAQREARERMPAPQPLGSPGPRLMLNGNEALALGAMAAGLKFCAFYPMSPATSTPIAVASAAKAMGIVVEQAEDEIAAVNMAIGASYAGARAMTATSGGGLALMSEGVSLAAVSETPLVVMVAMRPGPATGLATRTEQADLNLVLYAGHGEFPKAVLCPGSLEQCFDLMVLAFDLAERYQGPVFMLTDQYLADSYRDAAPFDLTAAKAKAAPVPTASSDDAAYERYAFSPDGISPRLLPGLGKALVVADSHEHTPDGHVTENLSIRVRMQDKRMAKLAALREESVPPSFGGPEDCEVLLVAFGSALGAVEEAAEALRQRGITAGHCHFSQVWPLRPETFLPRFSAARKVVVVESNSTGQLAALIRRETGFSAHASVLRYDGLPLTAGYILEQLQRAKETR